MAYTRTTRQCRTIRHPLRTLRQLWSHVLLDVRGSTSDRLVCLGLVAPQATGDHRHIVIVQPQRGIRLEVAYRGHCASCLDRRQQRCVQRIIGGKLSGEAGQHLLAAALIFCRFVRLAAGQMHIGGR